MTEQHVDHNHIPQLPLVVSDVDIFSESEYTPNDYPALRPEQLSAFLAFERAYAELYEWPFGGSVGTDLH